MTATSEAGGAERGATLRRSPEGSGFGIRRLGLADLEAYLRLRREALEAEPLAFGASIQEDRALDPSFLRAALQNPSQALYGAFAAAERPETAGVDGGDLVGAVGIFRDLRPKEAHKARLWGLWVSPWARGHGLGRDLSEAAIEFARSLGGVAQVHLSVSEVAGPARALYESLGFVTWGTEPEALRAGGRAVAQDHMILTLGP